MSFLRILCGLALLAALPACKTQRTVLAGPTVTGLDTTGQSSADSKFGTEDPSGYSQNASQGLNVMSDQMFGGKLEAQSQKEYSASKKFLTREYGGKKEFASKNWKGDPKGRTWTDKLFDTDETSETDNIFSDAGRQAAVKESAEGSKMARTKDFAGADQAARTGNYRPAERALESGRDLPKLTDARPTNMSAKEKAIRDRIANSSATASEINKFLGKP